MSVQITTAMVKQYTGNVEMLCQQKGSRLRMAVREEGVTGKEAYFDQIGPTTARKRTSRHADTPLVSTPHARRRVGMADYDWADLIDKFDDKKILISPESPYAMNAAWAMGRAMDDAIIAAASGTAYTGEEGSTSTAFDDTNNRIAHGSTNLTLSKLLSTKEIFDGWDVDEDEPRYFILNSTALKNLLNTTEVKSSDYNSIKALVKGEIDTFLGFKFIRSERLAVPATTTRCCLAWAKTGMLLGVGNNVVTDIGPRRDKNMATQVYVGMSIGATRMDEKKVVEVYCWEGA